jgi:hypothetical protein
VSRIDAAARREYLVVVNAGDDPAAMRIPTATPGSSWTQLLGPATSGASGAGGRVALRVPPLTALLYRADADVPGRGAARLTLRTGTDPYTNLLRLRATHGSADPLVVGFAVRRAGAKGWTRVAVDDGAPYAAYVNPRAYRRGETVSFVAVARASDGSLSTSPVLTLQPRR